MLRLLLITTWLLLAVPPVTLGAQSASADDFVVVHCLLPGQVRQLGQRTTYVAPRRPARITAAECRERGGEYVLGAAARSPVQLWQAPAERGDVEAQAVLADIYLQGEGVPQDFSMAAAWYRRAAEQAHPAAMVSLGSLYEQGLGVPANVEQAVAWYQRAAGNQASVALDQAPARHTGGYNPHLAGPEITLIDPLVPVTRGLVKVKVPEAASEHMVIGRVTAPAGILRVTVNGQPVGVNQAGVFQHSAASGTSELQIVAIDQQGKRADLSLRLADQAEIDRPRSAPPAVDFGRYHALLVGNSRYANMPLLRTPATDVSAIGQVLKQKYGFAVTVLLDATRYQLLSALNELRRNLSDQDNLLVYYAGHGELESTNMRGHWLPVDAEPDNTANWVSNVTITDTINLIAARQLLVVADSCYSGTLTRSSIARLDAALSPVQRDTWLRAMLNKRARVVLSSGGVAPVMDEGGGQHSVFARAFLDVLHNADDLLSGRDLYQALSARVTHAAERYEFEQIPQYAPIARAGHESGDFFFVPR